MRYYGFSNFMLSSIQQGVQNFHVLHDMVLKYQFSSSGAAKVLHDWMSSHKTAIFLNGGNFAGLTEVYARLAELGETLSLPYCKFHEDDVSLAGMMTSCGIVVPTHIVDMMPIVRQREPDWSEWDAKHGMVVHPDAIVLAMFLSEFPLAR